MNNSTKKKNKCLEEVSTQKQEPETVSYNTYFSTSIYNGEASFVIAIKFEN